MAHIKKAKLRSMPNSPARSSSPSRKRRRGRPVSPRYAYLGLTKRGQNVSLTMNRTGTCGIRQKSRTSGKWRYVSPKSLGIKRNPIIHEAHAACTTRNGGKKGSKWRQPHEAVSNYYVSRRPGLRNSVKGIVGFD